MVNESGSIVCLVVVECSGGVCYYSQPCGMYNHS